MKLNRDNRKRLIASFAINPSKWTPLERIVCDYLLALNDTKKYMFIEIAEIFHISSEHASLITERALKSIKKRIGKNNVHTK